MLCNESRASRRTISGFTGGGGGFSSASCVDAWPVRPRVSAQLALTVTLPGAAPAVLSVAVLPAPESVPEEAFQFETETETPSGLVQLQVMVAEPGISTVEGLAEQLMVGGFFGGSGFTTKFAEQVATLLLFSLGSVTCAVIA